MTIVDLMKMFSAWAEERLMPPQNDQAQAVIAEVTGRKKITSRNTYHYWLWVFSGWAEARLTPEQNIEAQAILAQLSVTEGEI